MYSIRSLNGLARKFNYEIEALASIGVDTVLNQCQPASAALLPPPPMEQ